MEKKTMQTPLRHGIKQAVCKVPLLCMLVAFLACHMERDAFALSAKELCPTEKYDSVTVQGTYLGWQLPHTPDGTITVKLRDSHAPLHIIATETRARSLFGHNFNANVEVTYDYIQTYSKEGEICLRLYVLKTGKIIDEQKKTKFYH